MIPLAIVVNLFAYSLVASQPLAYLVFLTKAQRALSPPAYIELRQRINPVMTKRLPLIYLGTLVALVSLIWLSWPRESEGIVLVTSIVALVCLVVDVGLATRENVPINGVIDRWSPDDYPDDWETVRARWFAMFAYRQVTLVAGFLSLLAGAAFR
jgi:hypothetical protein